MLANISTAINSVLNPSSYGCNATDNNNSKNSANNNSSTNRNTNDNAIITKIAKKYHNTIKMQNT